jgi:hypothetical protein
MYYITLLFAASNTETFLPMMTTMSLPGVLGNIWGRATDLKSRPHNSLNWTRKKAASLLTAPQEEFRGHTITYIYCPRIPPGLNKCVGLAALSHSIKQMGSVPIYSGRKVS